MNINDKDILTVIAKWIDNRETWFSFALVSKKTSAIVRSMKDLKIIEFNKITFESWNDGDYRISCNWHGRYTKGSVGCRGTRVWFQPRGLKVLWDRDIENDKEYETLEEALNIFEEKISDPQKIFPGDCCLIRNEELSNIIGGLKGEKTDTSRFINKNSFNIINDPLYDDPLYDLFLNTDDDIIFVDDIPADIAWTIKNLEGTIFELERVLKLCEDNGVTFEWV